MSLFSEDGKLMLDEDAAKRDIHRIEDAIEKLQASEEKLKDMKASCLEMKGLAAVAMVEKIDGKLAQINKLIIHMRQIIEFTKRTIKKYQEEEAARISRDKAALEVLRSSIASSGAGHSGGTGRHG